MTIETFIFGEKNCESDFLIRIPNDLIKELSSLQFDKSVTTMDVREIFNNEDYQMCVQNAQTIESEEKPLFCLNFYYVFYAELEINLNRYFTQDAREQWSLLFVDYNFMPPVNVNNNYSSIQTFFYQPNILTILHNAKVKFCCLYCQHEWASARGRAIFQAEVPETNKYNILFAYLFTQKCEKCHRETKPSWYLDEATRVMKNVSRILLNKFYSTPSSSSSSSTEENFGQRRSDMRTHHHRDLCRACQEGSCYAPHWHYPHR